MIRTFFKKALLGPAVAATALATATPADAQYYRHRHHGDDAAVAGGAGILGLAVGAAIASNGRGYYNGGYYDGYYTQPGYTYYYNSYPSYYPYYNGYYYNGYRYNDGWFYDNRGRRAYDRHDWNRRWGGHDRDRDD